jgi:hypothetical protein
MKITSKGELGQARMANGITSVTLGREGTGKIHRKRNQ